MASAPLQIKLQWDDVQLFRRFGDKFPKRVAFGARGAIFDTLIDIQRAEVANFEAKFVVRARGKQFFEGGGRAGGAVAKITHFPAVASGQLFGEIAIDAGSQASNRRTILPLFEEGGIRAPFTQGAHASAVPILGRPARPSISGPVPPQYTFAGLNFRGYRRGTLLKKRRRSGLVPETIFGEFGAVQRSQLQQRDIQWKGDQRTFILAHTEREPFGGVFQRYGRGRDAIREIYEFKPPFPVDNRLDWIPVARTVGTRSLHDNMLRQLLRSIELTKTAA